MKEDANKLIPLFLSSFTSYKSNLRARIRADSIVVDLEDNANKLFTKFVDLSSERYRAAKSGWSIYKILNNQSPKYSKINTKIGNDVLFNTTYLSNIKKELSKTVSRNKNKEINSLRNQISKSIKFKNLRITKTFNNLMKNNTKYNNKTTENKKMYKTVDHINSGINDLKMKYIQNEIFLNDNKKFNDNLEDYYNLLEEMRMKTLSENNLNKINKKKMIKETNSKISEMEAKLKSDNIGLLNYTDKMLEKNNSSKKKKKNNDFSVYMNNLLRFKYFHDKAEKKTITTFPTVFYNTISNNFKNNEDNFKDTVNIVKKESDDSKQMKNKFNKNRRNLDRLLGKMKITDDFGDFHEIEKNIKLKFRNKIKKNAGINSETNENIKGRNSFRKKSNNNTDINVNYFDKYETKIQRRQKIKNQFKEIYEDKLNEWKLEEKKKNDKNK